MYYFFSLHNILFYLKILFIFREGEGREKDRERNTNVWLSLVYPLLGAWPATQACALTGNWTSDPSVRRLVFNPLSHTNQGTHNILINYVVTTGSITYTNSWRTNNWPLVSTHLIRWDTSILESVYEPSMLSVLWVAVGWFMKGMKGGREADCVDAVICVYSLSESENTLHCCFP